MALADQLAVGILADIGKLSAGLKDASDKVGAFGDKVDQIGKRVSSTGDTMTKWVTGPILAVGAAVTALAVNVGNVANNLLTLEAQTGISTTSLQEWAYASVQAGGSAKAVESAIFGLSRKLPELANETGEGAEALARLGLEFSDIEKLEPEKVFELLLERLSTIPGVLERNAVASKVLGLGWKEVSPIIAEGADNVAKLRQEAHDLGIVIDREGLVQADQFRRAWDSVKAQLGAVKNEIGISLAPLMQNVFIPLIRDKIVPALKDMADKVKGLVQWFMDLDPEMKKTILLMGGLVVAIGPLLSIVGRLTSAVHLLTGALTFLAAHPLVAALILIELAIVALWAKFEWFRVFVQAWWDGLIFLFQSGVNGIILMINLLINGINLLVGALNLIPGISIPGLGAIGYIDFSKSIGDASRTVAGAIKEGQEKVAAATKDGLETVATDVATSLDDMTSALGTRMEDTNAFLESIGIDISKELELLGEDTQTGLNNIAAQLGAGRLGEGVAKLVEMETSLNKLLEVSTKTGNEWLAAGMRQYDAQQAYATAEQNYLSELATGTAASQALTKLILDNAKQELDAAIAGYKQLDSALASGMESVRLVEAQIIEQKELIRAAQIGINDMLNVSIAGFFDMKASFDRGVESLKFTLGNVELSFDRNMADIKIKIGDLSINLTKALGLLNTDLIAALLPALGPIALVAIGMGIVIALLKDIEKVGDFIHAILIMLVTPFIIIGNILKGIVSFFTGKSAEATAIPTMQLGGIVPGLVGQPQLIMAHGGEPIGAAGIAQVLNYEMIGRAVAAGVYDAMVEVLSKGKGTPYVIQMGATKLAQGIFPALLSEQERRGGAVLVT